MAGFRAAIPVSIALVMVIIGFSSGTRAPQRETGVPRVVAPLLELQKKAGSLEVEISRMELGLGGMRTELDTAVAVAGADLLSDQGFTVAVVNPLDCIDPDSALKGRQGWALTDVSCLPASPHDAGTDSVQIMLDTARGSGLPQAAVVGDLEPHEIRVYPLNEQGFLLYAARPSD